MRLPPDATEPARPGAREIVPFSLIMAIGTLPASFAIAPGKGWTVVAAYVVVVASVAVQLVSARRPRRTWVDPVGAWLVFLALGLLGDATGGPTSGVAVLVVVPILWLALFGNLRELAVAAGLTFGSFVVPHLLDPHTYPTTDLHRAVLWTSFALLLAPVVQQLVRQLSTQQRREQQTAARLRAMMSGASLTSLISTDPSGIITSANIGAEQMLGYGADELVGQPATMLHDPTELGAVAVELGLTDGEAVLRHLSSTRSPSRIWRFRRKDGQYLHVRLAVTELRDHDDALNGYLGVAIDSTAAHEATTALAAAEQRWRLAMDHLPDLTVLMLDADLGVSMVAGAGALRTGLADSLGGSLKAFSTPRNVELITQGVHAALEHGSAHADLRSTANDSEHHVVFCAMPHEDGHRAEVLTLARDVGEERVRARAVAAARDRAESLLTHAPHGVAVIALDTTIEHVNPALCKLLGRTESELVGTMLAEVVSPDANPMVDHLRLVASRAPGNPPVHAEWSVLRGDDATPVYLGVGSTVIVGVEADQVLMTFTDLSERHRHEKELSWLAEHDTLTGLANRRRFERELDLHLAGCRRLGARGALLVVDLDHFKAVNDVLGHSAGDRLLTDVARALRASVRSTDLVARLGGDEFAVILPDADRLGAEVVAQLIVNQVRAAVGAQPGVSSMVTASVGLAVVDTQHLDPEALLASADLRMYDAKRGGRDRWVIGSPVASDPARSDETLLDGVSRPGR